MTTLKALTVSAMVLWLATPSLAAYQNPVVKSNQLQSNGSVLVTFEFAGDAGEPTVTKGYVIQRATTATELRNWVDDTISELDLIQTASKLASIQPGQTVPKLARVQPVLSACRVWVEKLERYLRVKDAGVTAIAVDVATLKTNIENTYPASCVLTPN